MWLFTVVIAYSNLCIRRIPSFDHDNVPVHCTFSRTLASFIPSTMYMRTVLVTGATKYAEFMSRWLAY